MDLWMSLHDLLQLQVHFCNKFSLRKAKAQISSFYVDSSVEASADSANLHVIMSYLICHIPGQPPHTKAAAFTQQGCINIVCWLPYIGYRCATKGWFTIRCKACYVGGKTCLCTQE